MKPEALLESVREFYNMKKRKTVTAIYDINRNDKSIFNYASKLDIILEVMTYCLLYNT